MEQEKIIEGNKLIAEFMGMIPFENPYRKITKEDGFYRRFNEDGSIDIIGDLNFNLSWDWLMPVVEKIDGFDGVTVTMRGSKTVIILNDHKNISCHTIVRINSTWRVVVDFIKWYNQNNKN